VANLGNVVDIGSEWVKLQGITKRKLYSQKGVSGMIEDDRRKNDNGE